MTVHELADYSEIVQGFLIPVLAFSLAAEAYLMRLITREIFFLRMEIEAIKRASGIEVSIRPRR